MEKSLTSLLTNSVLGRLDKLQLPTTSADSLTPEIEFRLLVEGIALLLEHEGLVRKPYINSSLPYFSRLATGHQIEINRHVRTYFEICLEMTTGGESLRDTPSLLWRMLSRLKLAPTEDLFNQFGQEHVVEIYNDSNVQIFRNFRFFEICSYSLEELFSRQWWELFRRDDQMTQRLFLLASKIFSGEFTGSVRPNIATHIVEEVASSLSFRVETDFECASPLVGGSKVVAVCAIERAKLLNPALDALDFKKPAESIYEQSP